MRAEGTPILVRGDASRTLTKVKLGGSERDHNERWLQELIHRHPECIPMDRIEPGFSRLIPICMELELASGYVDNLLMTPEGDIVIIEAKLFRNPEARREVVAQALDYASSLFGMEYGALERAVLKAEFDGAEQPEKLYDLLGEADTLDEPTFVDAVNMNLRSGRIVVLVVGDGIRTGVEDLSQGLQSHAGFHFTFALVELAVFEVPGEGAGFVIVPNVLAKTYMIERGIVRIDDRRSQVVPASEERKPADVSSRQSITTEQFYEAMRDRRPDLPERLRVFLDKLSALGVYPDFQRSLNLKWDAPNGKQANFGYVTRGGLLNADNSFRRVFGRELSELYLEELAKLFGGEVYEMRDGNAYVTVKGKPPRIETLVGHFDAWYDVIERFVSLMRRQL